MPKPTYEQLEKRVRELETQLGQFMDTAMEEDHHELFELDILFNISRALASTRDLDTLLAIVIDEVNKALLTEGAGVLLYDENRGDLYWRVIKDKRDILNPQKSELRLPLDSSIAGWVFQNNKPARVNDTSKDPRYYPEMTRRSGFDIKKVLQVPLNTGHKPIGVLMVMNKLGGDFTDQDENLAVSMAASIAMAIENATVYSRLEKSRDDLEMLYKTSMALATSMDLDHLLEFVLAELNDVMDTEAAGLVLYDEHKGDLYWRKVQDRTGIIKTGASALRLPLDNSISGRVFRTGEPEMVNNPTDHPLFYKQFQARSGFAIRNEVIVPLHTREETLGVLVVINKTEGQFTQDDVQVCSSLAGVVAMAVENAMFFDELLKNYNELEDLNRVKSKILNHLSHELRTPLAIIQGTLATMDKELQDMGVTKFDRKMARMQRRLESLNKLASQVESIMMTGYTWERRQIIGFLDAALTLMEVQAERTPEIDHAAEVIKTWLVKTFPTRNDKAEPINIRDFGLEVFNYAKSRAEKIGRGVRMEFLMENSTEILMPKDTLQAIVEGIIRNAVEATPDHGVVKVSGAPRGERYIFSVRDTGIGIPERDKDLIFEGFYSTQDTESYSSGQPYSFNAGGKGIDLLRIRMFSELYGFKLSFTTKRCPHLAERADDMPGDAEHCPHCDNPEDCLVNGGSEFVVDFPIPSEKSLAKYKSPAPKR